jgi:tetratricopeptide (TPR) repeat protein
LARTFVELGKPEKARDHFLKSVDFDGDFAPAFYHLAHTMEGLHMLNETKVYFEKATQVDQNYVEAYYHLGRTLNAPGEFDLSRRNYETAAEINSDYADVHYGLGKLLSGGHKITKDGTLVREPDQENAIKHYKRAIGLDPNHAKAHFHLAHLLHEMGQLSTARRHYGQAIKIDPAYARGHYHLALLLNEELAVEEAVKAAQTLARAGGSVAG